MQTFSLPFASRACLACSVSLMPNALRLFGGGGGPCTLMTGVSLAQTTCEVAHSADPKEKGRIAPLLVSSDSLISVCCDLACSLASLHFSIIKRAFHSDRLPPLPRARGGSSVQGGHSQGHRPRLTG